MRIAIDVRPLTSKLTGIGRYTHNILFELLATSPEHEWFLYADRALTVELPDYPNVHMRVGKLKSSHMSTAFAQIFFPIWSYKDKVDIFWSPRHHLPLLLTKKITKITTIHDIVWKRYPETMTSFGRLLERFLMPISLRLSTHIISVSTFTKSELIDTFNIASNKITVTPLAPTNLTENLISELPTNLLGKKFFLFVGTLEPRKNLKNLLISFKEFCKKNDDYYLAISGKNGWGNQSIIDVVRNLDLNNKVILLGYTKENVLHALYKNCNALLMPSLYEGFGLPAIEALNYAKPVVATSQSAISNEISPLVINTNDESVESILDCLYQIKNVTRQHFMRPELPTWQESAAITKSILFKTS